MLCFAIAIVYGINCSVSVDNREITDNNFNYFNVNYNGYSNLNYNDGDPY